MIGSWRRCLRCRMRSPLLLDRKSTRLNSSHSQISYAVFCLKKKKKNVANIYQFSSIFPDITSPIHYCMYSKEQHYRLSTSQYTQHSKISVNTMNIHM